MSALRSPTAVFGGAATSFLSAEKKKNICFLRHRIMFACGLARLFPADKSIFLMIKKRDAITPCKQAARSVMNFKVTAL